MKVNIKIDLSYNTIEVDRPRELAHGNLSSFTVLLLKAVR